MTQDEEPLALPATVRAYLTDPAYRTGTDALLEYGPDRLPPETAFAQLGEYHAARGAAELTRYDYAETLHRAWNRVWGARMGTGWTVASIDRLAEREYEVTPQGCWEGRCLTLFHDRGRYSLFTALGIEVGRTTIAFAVETETRALRRECTPFTWRDDDDWEQWFVYSVPLDPADPAFRLEALTDAAEVAIAAAEGFAASRASSRRSGASV